MKRTFFNIPQNGIILALYPDGYISTTRVVNKIKSIKGLIITLVDNDLNKFCTYEIPDGCMNCSIYHTFELGTTLIADIISYSTTTWDNVKAAYNQGFSIDTQIMYLNRARLIDKLIEKETSENLIYDYNSVAL